MLVFLLSKGRKDLRSSVVAQNATDKATAVTARSAWSSVISKLEILEDLQSSDPSELRTTYVLVNMLNIKVTKAITVVAIPVATT